MSHTITLPWPGRTLSPNGRVHHMTLHRAKKAAKKLAWAETTALGLRAPTDGAPIFVGLTFHPKTANAVDVDNAVASCKAYLDGIAAAMGANDSTFRLEAPVMAEPVKGGAVVVVLS